jgi:hypothetical protein
LFGLTLNFWKDGRGHKLPFFVFIFSSLEGEVHYSAEEAVKFIEDRITEESKSSRHLRGPHLAKLELIRRLRSQGCNDEYKLGKKTCEIWEPGR